MAIGTNTYQTYTTIGIREDLIDVITNISPIENMVTKMTGTGKAQQTYHEWQNDNLPAATANAHPEGEVAAQGVVTPTVRQGNYTQILVQDFSVTDTNEAVNAAGRPSEIAYQKAKYTKALSNDIEYALIVNTAAVSGASGGTARQMKGMLGWVTTNVSTGATSTSGSAHEALFNTNLGLIWAQGGQEPYTALVGAVQKRIMSSYTGNNTRFQQIEKEKITATVSVYESDYGKVNIKLHRVMGTAAPGTILIVGDWDLWKKAWLRQKGWETLARTGEFTPLHLSSELTLESRQEKGSGNINGPPDYLISPGGGHGTRPRSLERTMIFRSHIVQVEEDHAVIRFTHGQELGPHLQACHELRLHDEQNGMSTGRQFQLAALLPDVVVMKLLCERPEVFKDGKEMSKWLRTDEAKPFRTSRDPTPIRGDSLQLIIR